MKYIIASRTDVAAQGIDPAQPKVVDGRVVLNENELRYRWPDMTPGQAAALVKGTVVPLAAARDFIRERKTFNQIINEQES